jgi:ATP-dependent exoDNAse (exonuclease V) beta subunit
MEREGVTVPIFKPNDLTNGTKTAPSRKLEPGVYPEHMVYLKSAGICGQSDLVEVVNGRVNIIDYKTNKEIKTESYKNWRSF